MRESSYRVFRPYISDGHRLRALRGICYLKVMTINGYYSHNETRINAASPTSGASDFMAHMLLDIKTDITLKA